MTKLVLPVALLLVACGGDVTPVGASEVSQSSAAGGRHEHLVFDDPHFQAVVPAGELCDFDFQIDNDTVRKVNRFYDADGNRVRVIWQVVETNTHTNLDTGVALTEEVHYSFQRDLVTGEEITQGMTWQLRDEDGRLVLLHAGRTVYAYDPQTDSWYLDFLTPNSVDIAFEFAQTICPQLGGAPAPLPE